MKEKIIAWLASKKCIRNKVLESVKIAVTCEGMLVFGCSVKNCIALQDFHMAPRELPHGVKLMLLEEK